MSASAAVYSQRGGDPNLENQPTGRDAVDFRLVRQVI